MTKASRAGGEYSIATCGHVIKPGEPFVSCEGTTEIFCPQCWGQMVASALAGDKRCSGWVAWNERVTAGVG